ncbi:lactosylceramide 4-alpha-galactosyltransferase-like isoform X2 [Convolutriloba macropyga]
MSTKFISMRLRPSMCNMVKRHYPSKIGFYGINLDYLFKNTPLDGVQRELSKQWMAVHSSDLMRQALVYKFGGYYADLDVITIRSLRRLHNVYPFEMFFPMKDVSTNCTIPKASRMVGKLNNGIFHFKAGSEFVWKTMVEMRRVYKDRVNDRFGVGPVLVGDVARKFLNLSNLTVIETKELTLLPPFTFLMPAVYPKKFVLTVENKNSSFWDSLLRCSKVVHIFNSDVKDEEVTGNPKRELLSYLGPRYCPASFVHLKQF